MNIDMTRTRRADACSRCRECLHYHGEDIYCIGDKDQCWNWEYDREKDPCDPAYMRPSLRQDSGIRFASGYANALMQKPIAPEEDLFGMINDLVYQNHNLMKMMQYKEEQDVRTLWKEDKM